MALAENEVTRKVTELLEHRSAERRRLERIWLYLRNFELERPHQQSIEWNGLGPLRWLPSDAPMEIRRLAALSRVNFLKYVVNAGTQVMYVDGYREPKAADDQPSWEVWQRNGMDARQVGVHRAALAYGASYVTVLPGDPVPVIRGVSPRKMTAVYGEDDQWPELAIERRRSATKSTNLWRLYDDANTWWVESDESDDARSMRVVKRQAHDVLHVPVVRFLPTIDDDDVIEGEVEPYIPLQDQINITTFGLLVAQHYSAFRQRYILGWIADTEEKRLQAGASKLWTFDDPDTKVGEFGETDLKGYIDSREATLRHLATLSQQPAHELLGQLANMSAEALAAAESSRFRANTMRQVVMGESWEQVLNLAGEIGGQGPADPTAYVRWRDMEARSLSQVADALGKMATMLGIPVQELWERIPGVSQQEVERWKAAAKEGDAFAQLTSMLERQAAPAPMPAPTQ